MTVDFPVNVRLRFFHDSRVLRRRPTGLLQASSVLQSDLSIASHIVIFSLDHFIRAGGSFCDFQGPSHDAEHFPRLSFAPLGDSYFWKRFRRWVTVESVTSVTVVSSVYWESFAVFLPDPGRGKPMMLELFRIARARGSADKIYNIEDSGQPWRTPLPTEKGSVKNTFMFSWLRTLVYSNFILRKKVGPNSIAFNTLCR